MYKKEIEKIIKESGKWRKEFSNFHPFEKPLRINNLILKTNEHFYQAMKFSKLSFQLIIAHCKTPSMARKLAKHWEEYVRAEWREISLETMLFGLLYKFNNNNKLFRILLSHKEEIVELNNWHDNFWGNCLCDKCKSKKGENNLGKLLMAIRDDSPYLKERAREVEIILSRTGEKIL